MTLVPTQLCGPVGPEQGYTDYSVSVERHGFVLQHCRRWYTDNRSSAKSTADIGKPIGKEVKDAAWYYPEPITDKAAPIKDHVAFCT